MTTPDSTDFRFQQELFNAVIRAYRAIRASHPLAASQPDPDSQPNKRLTFSGVEFVVDVENATSFALKGRPNQTALQRVWFQLVTEDDDEDAELARHVITLTSEVYRQRDLDPALYFRTIRRGSGDSSRRRGRDASQ
jgi:hypothetical protein